MNDENKECTKVELNIDKSFERTFETKVWNEYCQSIINELHKKVTITFGSCLGKTEYTLQELNQSMKTKPNHNKNYLQLNKKKKK